MVIKSSAELRKDLLRIEAEKVNGRVHYTPASEVLREMRQSIDRANAAGHE